MPVTFLALGLGGLSLMGLPPSGGFAAKWLLMKASIASGQWLWAIVMAARRTAGGRIPLSRAGAGAFGREPAIEEGARAQPREHRVGSGACRSPARVCAAVVLRLPADRPPGRGPRAAMSALAQQFGPGLLIATFAAPLVVLAALPRAAAHAVWRERSRRSLRRPRLPPARSRLAARPSAPSCQRCA